MGLLTHLSDVTPLCAEYNTIFTQMFENKRPLCVENNTIFTQMLENKKPFVRKHFLGGLYSEGGLTFGILRYIHTEFSNVTRDLSKYDNLNEDINTNNSCATGRLVCNRKGVSQKELARAKPNNEWKFWYPALGTTWLIKRHINCLRPLEAKIRKDRQKFQNHPLAIHGKCVLAKIPSCFSKL